MKPRWRAEELVQCMVAPMTRFALWLSETRWSTGASILRLCFGFIVFSLMVMHVRERHLLWGPSGLVSGADYWRWFGYDKSGFNIFALPTTDGQFDILYLASLLVVVLFMVGLYTRLVTLPFALVTWSLYHRNPWITNGGTRLLCIIVLYLIIADLGRLFSVDAMLKSQKREPGWLRCMLHNTSMLLIITQVCIVYIFSTFYKIEGSTWQEGTAIYYALMEPQFHVSPLIGAMLSNVFIVTLAVYGTLLYQCSFPWLILHPKLKWLALGGGVLFHSAIAVLMGLWWFSAVLISCEAVLISDSQYQMLVRRAKHWLLRIPEAPAQAQSIAGAPS